jgi:HSP20 family protein
MARKDLALFSDFDRFFDRPLFASGVRWPALRSLPHELSGFVPEIDVFERGNALVTKVDLPGMKKDEVKVEVNDGQLVISGERRSETEETKDHVYRTERSYGSFSRTVPLPTGVKVDDIRATFANGVLEVAIPLPAKTEPKARQVQIQDGATTDTSAVTA